MLPTNNIITMNHRYENEGHQPFLEIWSIPSEPSQVSALLATYLLPFFHGSLVKPFLLRYNFDQHVAQGLAFHAQSYAIISITDRKHELVVPLSALLTPQVTTSTGPVEYLWSEWGPRSSRLFHRLDYLANCGTRIVCSDEILDFSPNSLTVEGSSSSHHSQHECTTNLSSRCADWHSDGPCALPYRSIPCKLPPIHRDHIIFSSQTKEGPKVRGSALFFLARCTDSQLQLLIFDLVSPAEALVDIVSL